MALLETTAAAAAERAKLQRHFGRFDILFFLICTIVGVDTIASVASSGGEAFTWMLILAIAFFVPQALLFAELGSAFPQEGGPYFWTRLAFGRLVGAVNNFLYWITNPVWIGGTLAGACVGAIEVFFHNGNPLSTMWFYVVALVFVWVSVLAAILSFSQAKWLPTAGAFARFALLGLFTVSCAIYAAKHGVHGLGGSAYKPSYAGFVALVGVLLFNYVGFELPSSAGEEMTNPKRDVPFAIARSAGASVLLYALPVLGILIVLPATAVTNFGGFADAMKDVFTVYGGSIAKDGTPTLSGAGTVLAGVGAVLFILCLLTSGVTWIMGSDRALAVSCYDGAGPRFLGVISARFGTPVRVNIFSGIVATGIVVLAETITSGNAAKYFGAVLGVTISTTLISYLGIYPAVWKLRRSHPEVARPFRMPWMRPLTVLLVALIVIATIQLIAPGLGDSWFGSNYAPSGWDPSQKWIYLLTEAVPVLCFALVGVLFWALGSSTRAQVVTLDPVEAEPVE
ncbi:APC family permease [Trebonia kvetii]|uniref:APC family permease n=1 Tax=Trebonia kvetii TaxID=2480626 RepID=A0A6P2BMT1_9ACTN|nr:APC family permease [Trebonia kvetii]TVZ00280.1 APC family permease [Trebonia kvetii]